MTKDKKNCKHKVEGANKKVCDSAFRFISWGTRTLSRQGFYLLPDLCHLFFYHFLVMIKKCECEINEELTHGLLNTQWNLQ